ncbi:MAG: YhbY family RNA-binding protein, partial [Deltaproteobacteria bacterium]|nr:YhbY family RNA-binding protein [Deltaproteobacteria bacterium]
MVDTENTDAPDSDDDDEASAKPARVKNPLALGGLTGKQRRHLRGLGHALSAVVQVGKTGVTPALIENANVQLDAHELIKVKVGEAAPSDRHSTAEELALATKSAL